ncbi:ribonuclease HI [Desulfurivibrio alkaliphilus]|uniref:Ribonuclease H n=1 Tax=Desulfurivibrio alkaliphilus (strain DSM 19089 / UNIQEM U267 / AHT2) TaxID=589865 RepID=D6Z1J2_DESAT|nr:ribonuclease HI [Desulfurivibrio alkaliphilus]ADH87326.1 ribonuclease H [Desulfurivibrio alkaliphilus AHT 2]
MAAGKKVYAVAVGRKPGIYHRWDLAKAQVYGFPGARYKGFAVEQEARAWLAEIAAGGGAAAGPSSRRSPAGKPARKPQAAGPPPDGPEGVVTIYTDGGVQGNPGPGGYGVVQLYNGESRELAGGFRLTTNNRMELMACIVALSELEHRDKPVRLYSDSSYVVNGINKGWAVNWRRRGWRKSDGQPALNRDLWGQLLDLLAERQVEFYWVRGHAGNHFNERCDQLAVASARRPGLPVDVEYEKTITAR